MALKRGYKKTEVGIVPEDWNVTRLGTLANFRTGPFGSALHKSDYVYGGVPVINPMQIVDGKIVHTPRMAICEAAAQNLSEFRLLEGDIVIGRRGEMGRCAVVQLDQSGWLCGTGSMIVRPKESLEARFAQRLLSSSPVIAAIEATSVGTTMSNLNQSTLSNLKIPIPPTYVEQQAIAEALNDADALIESMEQLVTKKHQLKQGMMQELLTGRRRLQGFSEKWECISMGEIFSLSGGFAASRDQLSTDGYCYLHYGDIHMSDRTLIRVTDEFQNIPKLNISLRELNSSVLLEDGDAVFVDASEDEAGVCKYVVVSNPDKVPFISGLHTIVAKSKVNFLDNGYKKYCFQASSVKEQFRFYAVGTKVLGVSKSNIAKVTIQVPSLDEQAAIASVLTSMDDEVYNLKIQLQKTRQLKQGMMQELLSGRVRLV